MARLRTELVNLRNVKGGVSTSTTANKTISILQEENLKLTNEISQLRADKGSIELINSYKDQIKGLNLRIHELEEERSNLSAQLINLRNEWETKTSVDAFNRSVTMMTTVKASEATDAGRRDVREVVSPVRNIEISSGYSSPKDESLNIRMTDSKFETVSGNKVTYGQARGSEQVSSSGISSSGVYGTGASLSGSEAKYGQGTARGSEVSSTSGPTYQASSSGIYQAGSVSGGSGSYQAGSISGASGSYQAGSIIGGAGGVYQAGSSSGVYQGSGSGVFQSRSGSGVFQAGGATGASGYQASSYQPYQPGSYQSGSYQSSTSYRSTAPGGQAGDSSQSGSQAQGGYQYRYDRK